MKNDRLCASIINFQRMGERCSCAYISDACVCVCVRWNNMESKMFRSEMFSDRGYFVGSFMLAAATLESNSDYIHISQVYSAEGGGNTLLLCSTKHEFSM